MAVIGQNLALNIADHGFQISVFNRTTTTTFWLMKATPSGRTRSGAKRGLNDKGIRFIGSDVSGGEEGADTGKPIDQARGKFYHIDWPDPERPQSEF